MTKQYIPMTDNIDALQAATLALAAIIGDSHKADGQPLMRYPEILYATGKAILDEIDADTESSQDSPPRRDQK